MFEAKTVPKNEKTDRLKELTLSKLAQHIALVLTSDGTLLKSTFDQSWTNLFYELRTNKVLGSMQGRPAILDEIRFYSNGPELSSNEVSETMRLINFGLATAVGELVEHGWFINRRAGLNIQRSLDEMPDEYKKFVEKAVEIARQYVARKENITDLLPLKLRNLIRS